LAQNQYRNDSFRHFQAWMKLGSLLDDACERVTL